VKGPHVLRHKPSGHYKAGKGIYNSRLVADLSEAQVWRGSGAAKNAIPHVRNPHRGVGTPETNPLYYGWYMSDPAYEAVPVNITIEVVG
jgi:hypothetical protein